MKKIVLTLMFMLAAGMSFAQIVRVVDSGSANGFIVKAVFMPEELEAVDLGLESGTKWANLNIGAEKAGDFGAYIMWGSTDDCSDLECSEGNSKTYGVEMDDWQGDVEYDAATANWGDGWMTPTSEQMSELIYSCNWEWTTEENIEGEAIKGFKVSSLSNDNYIFIPAAGYRKGTSFSNQQQDGLYWTSTPYGSETGKGTIIFFYNGYDQLGEGDRFTGLSVRPVYVQ